VQLVGYGPRSLDDALLEHGGNLRIIIIGSADEVEAADVFLRKLSDPLFDLPELSDIQLAELRDEIDVCPSADGVRHQMAAVVLRTRRKRVTGHSGGVAPVAREGGNAPGNNVALPIDVKKVRKAGRRIADIDLNELSVGIGPVIVVAPERDKLSWNLRDDVATAPGGHKLPVGMLGHRHRRPRGRILPQCSAHGPVRRTQRSKACRGKRGFTQ